MMDRCPDPPVLDPQSPLATYWDKPVCELATLDDAKMPPELKERHYLYSLLVAALVSNYWNGNKRGQDGTYPWREKQRLPNGIYRGGQYLGHNIACIGVDGIGEVIDFDFNHNEIFSSSVEHAESRLVRRVFSLAQVYDDWRMRRPEDLPKSQGYANLLSNVTIYTSLESCAQCSGIMALGQVKSVVYLQHDPGQFVIGNILWKLTTSNLKAPLPISADQFSFPYYRALNDAYKDFYSRVLQEPFYIDAKGTKDNTQSITSFLCTDIAKSAFDQAAEELKSFTVKYPEYKPTDTEANNPRLLTNLQIQGHTRDFYAYAVASGRRGTPHKL
jgi:tRNA(Arg) A34 adenosine deaminase TadA